MREIKKLLQDLLSYGYEGLSIDEAMHKRIASAISNLEVKDYGSKRHFEICADHHLNRILKDDKTEDTVLLYRAQQFNFFCRHCIHCEASYYTGEMVCKKKANFDRNDISCDFQEVER